MTESSKPAGPGAEPKPNQESAPKPVDTDAQERAAQDRAEGGGYT